MNNKMASLLIVTAFTLILSGCASTAGKINRLSINMHKDDVRALFGSNFTAKASKVDANGNVMDLWEFYDAKQKQTYQIFLLNDKVSQWGKREDLKAFPDLHAPSYNP
ncbi:MAG: hypothetical protein L6416_01245 [Candidatus Omnitrophica bacterium]|nr:hypothetical protein [Candidatus Omnitrophota bacterium]